LIVYNNTITSKLSNNQTNTNSGQWIGNQGGSMMHKQGIHTSTRTDTGIMQTNRSLGPLEDSKY